MSLLRSLSDGLRSLFRKERVSQELDEELNGFLEMAAEEKMKHGMNRKDALRAVRLERGNLEVAKEVVRSAGWESLLETLWQDFKSEERRVGKEGRCRRSSVHSKKKKDRCFVVLQGYVAFFYFLAAVMFVFV